MCPYLGRQGTTYLEPGDWQMTVSYRRYHAFRDYQGGKALPVPSPPELYANTRVNIFDLTLTHTLTKRFSVSVEVPFLKASRETYLEHQDGSPHTMRSSGVGDVKVIGNLWLLDPSESPNQNVSLKLGFKAPTGDYSAEDNSYRGTGSVLRPVDPAIQPGTGGWGLLFGAQAFKRIHRDTILYAEGTYLSNPREMNGTQTPFGDNPELTLGEIGYTIDSIPDLYLGRAGVTHEVLPSKGLSASFGLRTDGVPARDLIGGSDGYRLPGYSVSLEPGISFSRGKDFFSFSLPFTVKGHGSASVTDRRTQSPYTGIVTLADKQVILTYSRRF